MSDIERKFGLCDVCERELREVQATIQAHDCAGCGADIAAHEYVPADVHQAVVAALQEIAARPVVERNPDGVDQAAHTMQLIALEALVALGEATPSEVTRQDDDGREGHGHAEPLGCDVPPEGWWCSREKGHDGACAVRPTR